MENPLALIIEDDESLSFIFTSALKQAEFETEPILDGAAALARLAETTPAIILLDLHLPNVSGKEILGQIRSAPHLEHSRVVLVTADALLAESLRDQADLVLLKPISFEQLQILASRLRPIDSEVLS